MIKRIGQPIQKSNKMTTSAFHGEEYKALYGHYREDELEVTDKSDSEDKSEPEDGEKPVENNELEESEDDDEESDEEGKSYQENSDDDLADDILQGASPCNTKPQTSVVRSECGGISIINSNCGKRIEFSKKVLVALGEPENVQLLFNEKYLIIKSADQQGFSLKKMGARKVIYSAGLVGEVTGKFSLDFSNRTCISFQDYTEINDGSATAVAFIIK